MATFTERLAILIEAKTGAAVTNILGVGKAADTAGGAAGGAAGMFASLGSTVGVSATTMAAGLAAVAGGAVAFAAKSVTAFQDTALAALNLARVTNGNVTDASRLIAVADDYEVSAEALTRGLFLLSKAEGARGDKLRELGVQTKVTADGQTDLLGTLLSISDAYNKATSQEAKTRIAFAAFGRSAQGLVPILRLTRSELESAFENVSTGQLVTPEQAREAETFRLAMDDLGDAFGDVQRKLGSGLVPVLTLGARALALLADEVSTVLTPVTFLAEKLGFLGGESRTTAADAALLGGDLTDLGDDAEEAASSIDKARSSVFGLADAYLGVQEAQQRLVDLQREQLRRSDQIVTAQKRVQSAARSVADANDQYAEAQKRLNDLLAGPSKRDMEDASLSLEEAQQGVVEAALSVREAERRLREERGRADSTALDRRQAEAGVQDALLAQRRAAMRLEDAQQNLTDTQNKGAESTDDVKNARKELARADDAVKAAIDGQRQAESDLRTSQAESATSALTLARARLDVVERTYALQDAEAKARDATAGNAGVVAVLRSQLQGVSDLYPGLKNVFDLLDRELAAGAAGANPFAGVKASASGAISGPGMLENVKGAFANYFKNHILPTLFQFDDGGVIPGPVGQKRLVVAHGGETVFPTHKRGFTVGGGPGGDTYNINVAAGYGGDGYRMGREIAKGHRAYQRRAGRRVRQR